MWIWRIRYSIVIYTCFARFTLLILLFLFAANQDGYTPLYIASQNGQEKVVELLITLGKANVDLADKV